MDENAAVALLVHCTKDDTFLMMRELVSKPENNKFAGMLGIPCETMECEDEDLHATGTRLTYEELGTSLPFKFIDAILRFDHGVIFVAYTHVSQQFTPQPNDADVEYGGWLSETEIHTLSNQEKRIEVPAIFAAFKKHKNNWTP